MVADALSRRGYGSVSTLRTLEKPLQQEIIKSGIELVRGKLANLACESILWAEIEEEQARDEFLIKKRTKLEKWEN